MSACRCTRCADQERVLAALRRAVAPKEPAVVVGGRYVVGENPTYRAGLGSVEELGDAAGLSVVVTDRASSDGDVFVEQVDGNDEFWIDPRHLTPAPEPAAAPAVDDDLSRDILAAALHVQGRLDSSRSQDARNFLASEPMQRLRAAWLAEERVAAMELRRGVLGRLTEARRERDEARADLMTSRSNIIDDLTGQVRTLRAQRDDAQLGWDESASAWSEVHAVVPRTGGTLLRRTLDHIAALTAEVERLRAAQQLPDVGPVTRNGNRYEVDHVSYPDDRHLMETIERDYLHGVARARSVMAAIDAEDADNSSDDEVDAARDELGEAWCDAFGLTDEHLRTVIRAVDAHRAHRGQDGSVR